MTHRAQARYSLVMLLRRALRFTPSVLLLFACDHADLVGRQTGSGGVAGTDVDAMAGNSSGDRSSGGSATPNGGDTHTAGTTSGDAGARGNAGGAPPLVNQGGQAGEAEMTPNAAGNADGGVSNPGDGGSPHFTGGASGGEGGGEGSPTECEPVTEICDNGIDDDCSGLVDDCGSQRCVITMKTQNGSDYVWPWSVARDSAGNALVTGQLMGSGDFGGQQATSVGGFDIFLAKYSPNCELIWLKTWGSPKHDRGLAVAVAANDDIILGGSEGGILKTGEPGADIDLGGGMLKEHGNGDAFLARYTSTGAHLWSHLYGANSPDGVQDLALAPNGDIAITASTSGDFGGGNDLPVGAIAARYTSGGAHLWSTSLRYGVLNGVQTQSTSVAVDAAGSVLVAGSYNGGALRNGVNVGTQTTAFLTSLSADGQTVQFTKSARTVYKQPTVNTDDINRANSVVARGTTAIFAGQCVPPLDFGGGKVEPLGSWDAFVAGYDASGAHQFSFLDGAATSDIAFDIALDQKGNIGLVGQAYPQGVVVKYSSSGRWLWSKALDTPELTSTAFASDNSLAVTGHFQVTVDFGQGTQTPVGAQDGVLIIYNP